MLATESPAELLSSLPAAERKAWLDGFDDETVKILEWDWLQFWSRPSQRPPSGDWRTWLILAGRGFGKTRTGAEWVRMQAKDFEYVNIIAPTTDDARDVMVEGESGILACCPPAERPIYRPSTRQLAWPNGAKTLIFTADEPDRLRGKQHQRLWADEIAAWRYPEEAWDQAMFGLRLPPDPRAVATTTPRPIKLLVGTREKPGLMNDPTTHITRGTTYENEANLAPAFFSKIIGRYEGTRLGRQELQGDVLTDVPGALWTYASFEDRCEPPDLARVVVAVDPSGGDDAENAEQGIVVAGLGVDGRGYVLADRSCRLSPDGWGRRAIQAYLDHKADRVVWESNYGGAMVESNIKTVARHMGVTVATKKVVASRGKQLRAEPVAALFEQGKVSLVPGEDFDDLIDQCCTWTQQSGTSPDRLDAMVWCIHELMVSQGGKVEFT
jgi:predicted phage terminase large subunit-like protein